MYLKQRRLPNTLDDAFVHSRCSTNVDGKEITLKGKERSDTGEITVTMKVQHIPWTMDR